MKITERCTDDCVCKRMLSLIALGDMGQTRWNVTMKHEQALHDKIEAEWQRQIGVRRFERIILAQPATFRI